MGMLMIPAGWNPKHNNVRSRFQSMTFSSLLVAIEISVRNFVGTYGERGANNVETDRQLAPSAGSGSGAITQGSVTTHGNQLPHHYRVEPPVVVVVRKRT